MDVRCGFCGHEAASPDPIAAGWYSHLVTTYGYEFDPDTLGPTIDAIHTGHICPRCVAAMEQQPD